MGEKEKVHIGIWRGGGGEKKIERKRNQKFM